jgi:hypothetical protein
MNFNPSLPSLQYLPMNLAIDCAAGFCLSKITRVNTHLMMITFAVRCLSNAILFAVVNQISIMIAPPLNPELRAHKVFFYTSTLTNIIFVIALKEFQLIGSFTSTLFGLAIACQIFSRLKYIEDQENAALQALPAP